MKLLYVTATLPYGAGESFTIAEIDGLRRLGHTVIVAPMRRRGELLHVPEGWHDAAASPGLLSVSVAREAIAEAIKSPRCVCRVFSSVALSRNARILAKNVAVVPKAIWLAKKAREWKIDHIHANWAGCAATIAMLAAECSDLPWSFTAHRWDIFENNLLDLKAERASFVRFISRDGRNLAGLVGAAKAKEKGCVVHVGVALPPALPAARSVSSAPRILFCPATLSPVKGHSFLFRAMRLLGERGIESELWLAGSGPLEDALRRDAAALGILRRVRFMGQLPHGRILGLYESGQIDCVVLATLHEGIAVSLIEAMSYGIPVVSTATGGNPELLSGGCGMMVPPRDPDGFAQAVVRVLSEPAFAARLVRSARARVEDEFAVERTVDQLHALFSGSSPRTSGADCNLYTPVAH